MASKLFCVFIFAVLMGSVMGYSGLEVGFYKTTCPLAESIVATTVNNAFTVDPGVAPALIRLHFHDCFVRGCDGSVLIDSTSKNLAEKNSSMNLGIGGFDIIDKAKALVEAQCPNTVSCADIIAFAARDSVLESGAIHYQVPGGRRDGKVSIANEAAKNLPGPFFNVTELQSNFARKGLTMAEMVTLSGAHTIGDSHCSAFSKRLYSFNATYSQDPSLDKTYANYLRTKCPSSTLINDPIVPFDPTTPDKLDNNYYNNLKSNKGLLASDQVLWSGGNKKTRTIVKSYANHPSQWALAFAKAMVHMGSIDILTNEKGEIRKNCRVIN